MNDGSRYFDAAAIQACMSLLESLLEGAALELMPRQHLFAPGSQPELLIEFTGRDVPMLLRNSGELLLALEHLTLKALRIESADHDRLSFEAGGFKERRQRELRGAAGLAISRIEATGMPFAFPPMSSRERRILHLQFSSAGLRSESEGQGSLRHLVVYPEPGQVASPAPEPAAP